jgi:hypothetical protein
LVFVMEAQCVFFETGNEFVNSCGSVPCVRVTHERRREHECPRLLSAGGEGTVYCAWPCVKDRRQVRASGHMLSLTPAGEMKRHWSQLGRLPPEKTEGFVIRVVKK